jgi:DNA-binding CsgD family transcriptional regulator/GAF domain-containing protein
MSTPRGAQDPEPVYLPLSPILGMDRCCTFLTVLPRREYAGGVEVVRFVRSLAAASSFEQLERSFLSGFGRLMGVDIWGYNVVDPLIGAPRWFTRTNVSDTFIARYATARDHDPMRAAAYGRGETAYNRALMSAEEWEESVVYRAAYRLHSIRHVIEVPLIIDGQTSGNLHFGTTDRDFSEADVRLASAIGEVIADTVAGIDERDRLARERDQALTALDVIGTPIVISDPRATELSLNDAARQLLADVVDAEEHLYRLLGRPAVNGGFSRRIEVELATGEPAVVHGHSSPVPPQEGRLIDGGLITVLELEPERPGIALALLAPLTPREREVASLVVDGLADREIADRLCLSHHTVSQYVKSIYRKLAVDSRVALTRALLRPHP